jgi:hypothetical protein
MAVGWSVPAIAGVVILAIQGPHHDGWVMAFWTGLFASLGWAVAVLPLTLWWGSSRWLSDLRWSWATWTLLGLVVYALLLTPIMGRTALLILWYPALMGLISGLLYGWLMRRQPSKRGAARGAGEQGDAT